MNIDIRKMDIKMKVTPEQSKQVQEICFDLGITGASGARVVDFVEHPYLYIENEYLSFGEFNEIFYSDPNKEVSAEEFIRTKGFTISEEIRQEQLKEKSKPKALYRIKHQYDTSWYYIWEEKDGYFSEEVQDADLFESFDKALAVIEEYSLEGMIETIYCSSKA